MDTNYKDLVKRIAEFTLIPLFLIGTPIVNGIIQNNHYDSLSRQEKIVFLENRLKFYEHIPNIPGPRGGGWALIAYSNAKKHIQTELYKLKSYEEAHKILN